MIHLILGTKAQYIKTAPIVWRLQEEGIPFRIVDTGQHAAWTASLRQTLRIPQPAVSLRVGENLSGVRTGLAWLSRWLGRACLSPRWVYSRIFSGMPGLALVHGDTASAWLGACLARRAGLRLAHLEAGLSSESFLSPFPEEWFRQRTSRMADLLLAPSDWAAENLKRMRVRGRVVNLGANTGLEAVRFSLSLPPSGEDAPPAGRYGVAAIHRMETLYSARRMEFVVSAVAQAARGRRMIFILHEPTERALRRFRLAGRLAGTEAGLAGQGHGVELKPLLSHAAFLRFLAGAEMVLSDGGSVQEEAFYLNIPCLILRDRTERLEGLQPPANVCLARWSWEKVEGFLRAPEAWRGAGFAGQPSPSAEAVKAMNEFDSGGFRGVG